MNRTAVWGPSAKIGRQAALSQAKTQKLLRVRDAERRVPACSCENRASGGGTSKLALAGAVLEWFVNCNARSLDSGSQAQRRSCLTAMLEHKRWACHKTP